MNNIDINESDYRKLQYITLEMFNKFVYNKANLSKEMFEKELLGYTRKILNANLEKDEIFNAKIDILPISKKKEKNVNGSMLFKEDLNSKNHSVMRVNISKVINGTRNKGLSSPNPKVRMETITRYIETIQHEYRHYKQKRAIRVNDDRVGYTSAEKHIMSRESASMGIKNEFFYKLKNNYKNYFMEADARLSGKTESLIISKPAYFQTKQMIKNGTLKNITIEDVDKDAFDRTVSRETNDIVMSNEMSFFKATGNRSRITSNATDFSIACNKKILKCYPFLGVEYNNDGTRKSLEDIIIQEQRIKNKNYDYQTQKDINDYFDMLYTDILVHKMTKEEFKETTKRIGKENMNELLGRCNNYNVNNRSKKKQDLYQLCENSQCIIDKNSFSTTQRYKEYIEDLDYKIDKEYNDVEKSIMQKENIVERINNVYKTKSQRRESLNNEIKENKKYKNVLKIIKKPVMMWYKISEAFENDKQNKRIVDPDTLRRKSMYNSKSDFLYYDEDDVNLDEKRKELRELKDIREQKVALLTEAKDCYRESEKYKISKEKNHEKSKE